MLGTMLQWKSLGDHKIMDDLCRFKLLTECRPAVVARGKGGGSFWVKVEDAATIRLATNDEVCGKQKIFSR